MNVDTIIEHLLSVRGARPGRQVNLTEADVRYLCKYFLIPFSFNSRACPDSI